MAQLPIIAFDAETYYDPAYSLSKITTEAYIRSDGSNVRDDKGRLMPPFEEIGCSIWLPGDSKPVWYPGREGFFALQHIDWSKHGLLCHNTWFDGAILAWRYNIFPRMYFDTWAMAQPFYNLTHGTSLAKLAELLKLPPKGNEVVKALGKHLKDFTPDELAAYGRYCVHDTWLCRAIFQILLRDFPASELHVIHRAIKLYTDARILLDRHMLKDYLAEVVALKQKAYERAAELLGCSPEEVQTAIMSNEKMAMALQDLGVDPPTKISQTTGKVAWAFAKTDEEFTDLREHEDECVQALVEARLGGKSTIAETRAERLIQIAERGTLPVMLRYYAAHTGRFGGADGVNLQNLMRGGTLRKAMVAPRGHIFGVGDSKQIEARLLAYIAGQDDITAAFQAYDDGTGPDIYCVTASRMYGRPITEDDKIERCLCT